MRTLGFLLAALVFASSSATAEQTVGDTYVVPQLGYAWLDNDRDADDDITYGIAIGRHFSEAISLELALDRGSYDLAGSADDLDLTSLSINALHLFARDRAVSPFVLIGAGAAHNDLESADSHTHLMAQAGLGLMIQAGEKNDGALKFSFRPEIKARWTLPRDNDPQDKYLDYVAMLGFQFAFGNPRPAPVAAPAPAPEPAPEPEPAPPPPPADSDGDGVIDDRDQCPNTPRGVAVDAVGCPRRGSATLQGVTFELNSANLTPGSRPVLDDVAADLQKYPRLRVELQGHTDSSGADAYNMQLSERRANAVREYLISQGVAASQLVARGYGETQPVADNKTNEGRAQNRRVEMAVLENPGDVDVEIEQPQ